MSVFKEPVVKWAIVLSSFILTLTVLVAWIAWLDDPDNTDPRRGEVVISDTGHFFSEGSRMTKVCIGPDLLTTFQEDWEEPVMYTDKASEECAP